MAGNSPQRSGVPPNARGDELAALVDGWLAQVEQGLVDAEADLIDVVSRPASPAPSPPLEEPAGTEPGGHGAGAGVPEADATASRGSSLAGHPAEGIGGPLASIRVARGGATFDAATGGRVALARSGEFLRCPGGVAVRGPLAPAAAAFQGESLTAAAAKAFEFVAAWFGSPFDAVNVGPPGGSRLRWGFWGLSGDPLAWVLARWKAGDRSQFDALFARYGLDVVPLPSGTADATRDSASPPGSSPAPRADSFELLVRTERRVVRGASAAAVIGSDPRRLAVLARAGRERSAQLAQIDGALRFGVQPSLALLEARAAAESAPATTREMAVILLLALRYGAETTGQLHADATRSTSPDAAPIGWADAIAAGLARAGRPRAAREIHVVLASPELDESW